MVSELENVNTQFEIGELPSFNFQWNKSDRTILNCKKFEIPIVWGLTGPQRTVGQMIMRTILAAKCLKLISIFAQVASLLLNYF